MGSPKRNLDTLRLDDERQHPQFVTAVARAFSILRCFADGARALGNQEIARRTRLPKSTVSRLTFTLSSLGYLSYSESLGKYTLGTALLPLGHAYMQTNDVVAVARPLMRELAEYTQSAVMLGTADRGRMVLLEICQGDPMFEMKLAVGAYVPHGSTALGRADLAARPAEAFERYLKEVEKTYDPGHWPKLRAGLVRARQDYAQYGFCFSLGDWNPDVFAVGVPLVASDGSRILAFSCSGRVSVMTREKIMHDFGPRLVALRDRVADLVERQR